MRDGAAARHFHSATRRDAPAAPRTCWLGPESCTAACAISASTASLNRPARPEPSATTGLVNNSAARHQALAPVADRSPPASFSRATRRAGLAHRCLLPTATTRTIRTSWRYNSGSGTDQLRRHGNLRQPVARAVSHDRWAARSARWATSARRNAAGRTATWRSDRIVEAVANSRYAADTLVIDRRRRRPVDGPDRCGIAIACHGLRSDRASSRARW